MIILGVDPGVDIVGYGIIEYKYNNFEVLDYGCIRTTNDLTMAKRLVQLYDSTLYLIHKYKPDDMPHPYHKKEGYTSKEIWEKDAEKIRVAEEEGFKVLVIWDSEFKKNKKETIEKCLNFLNQ